MRALTRKHHTETISRLEIPREVEVPMSVEDFIKDIEIDKMLSDAHIYNKMTLLDLLSSDVCKLINLSL